MFARLAAGNMVITFPNHDVVDPGHARRDVRVDSIVCNRPCGDRPTNVRHRR